LSRANILAKTIEDLWDIKKPLSALPKTPVWSINCTTGETGHRCRFKDKTIGEYELGYAKANNFSLAKAMAASAAVPLCFGPLVIKTNQFHWKKRETWNAHQSKLYDPPFRNLHIYDGGLYDNLGTEPLFDARKQSLKPSVNISYLLVSDAGTPPSNQAIPHPLNPYRFKRLFSILQDQCRALRVGAFINFLNQKNKVEITGAYIWIGTEAKTSIEQHNKDKKVLSKNLLQQNWLSKDDAKKAASYPTTLRKLSESTFDLLEQHGYETAKWNIEIMQPQVAKKKNNDS
jgi:NTE family protein